MVAIQRALMASKWSRGRGVFCWMSVRIEDRTPPGPASLTGLPRNADQLTKHAVTPLGWLALFNKQAPWGRPLIPGLPASGPKFSCLGFPS